MPPAVCRRRTLKRPFSFSSKRNYHGFVHGTVRTALSLSKAFLFFFFFSPLCWSSDFATPLTLGADKIERFLGVLLRAMFEAQTHKGAQGSENSFCMSRENLGRPSSGTPLPPSSTGHFFGTAAPILPVRLLGHIHMPIMYSGHTFFFFFASVRRDWR